jgi:hypothetical protein
MTLARDEARHGAVALALPPEFATFRKDTLDPIHIESKIECLTHLEVVMSEIDVAEPILQNLRRERELARIQ